MGEARKDGREGGNSQQGKETASQEEEEGPAKAGAGDDTEWTNRGVGSETIRGGGPSKSRRNW